MTRLRASVRAVARLARRLACVAKAALPRWLVVALGAALVIPGPFDEIAGLVAVAVVLLVQPQRIGRARQAWRESAARQQP